MKKFSIVLFLFSITLLLPRAVSAETYDNVSAGFSSNSNSSENVSDSIFTNRNFSSEVGIMVLVFFTGFCVTSTCIYHFILKKEV